MAKAPTPARRSAPTPARRSPPPPQRQPVGRAASAPAQRTTTPPPAASAPATAPAKAPRKRSAPMGRALKFVRLADKNLGYALRLVGNWRGEATPEQKQINDEIVAKLKEASPLLERALIDVGLLNDSKFVPVEARGRAITEPFAAGERVAIRDKHYKPALHGAANDFEVVVQVEGMVKIRPTGDLRAAQIVVNRAHLVGLDDPEGDEGEGGGDTDGSEDNGEEATTGETDGDGADGDADPEDTRELNFDGQ